MLFRLGQIVATPAALELLESNRINPMDLIMKHAGGDWGDLDRDDCKANDNALEYGGRILSAYKVGLERLYVITEADHSSTCILLTNEY